jgi:hypothetical protein
MPLQSQRQPVILKMLRLYGIENIQGVSQCRARYFLIHSVHFSRVVRRIGNAFVLLLSDFALTLYYSSAMNLEQRIYLYDCGSWVRKSTLDEI